MINFGSFRTFRGPIFYKQETGMYLDNFFYKARYSEVALDRLELF